MGRSDHGSFTVRSLHFPRRLRKTKKTLGRTAALWPRFEPRTFQIQVRNINYWRAIFSNGKYSETLIKRQFLLTVSPYSMYSNQIATKDHPRFTAERRRRRSGALLFYWWVTFLARLAIAHVVSFSCGWEAVVLGAVRYLLRSDLTISAYDSDIHTSKFCC
jgi:hypothetical protein